MHRFSSSVIALALSGNVLAVGLGDLKGHPVLGEGLRLEIELLSAERQHVDAACFSLVKPQGDDDLPWLQRASLTVRKGAVPVLEVRTEVPLREPILQVAIRLGCGREVSREYVVMASPAIGDVSPRVPPEQVKNALVPSRNESVRQGTKARPIREKVEPDMETFKSRRAQKSRTESSLPDRLVLMGDADIGEPSLRLATEIQVNSRMIREAQRDILRLEYRMLMALNEHATSQMATAEKLRNMEGTLGELQQRAGEFAQRVEKEGALQPIGPQGTEVPLSPTVSAQTPSPQLPKAIEHPSDHSEWGLYGLLLGAALGLAGWFGWRSRAARSKLDIELEPVIPVPDVRVDPRREDEREELGGVDLPFEPAAMGMPMHVDVEIESQAQTYGTAEPRNEPVAVRAGDSIMSINATTVDEHFEANPVMELADIMLSFGRVKGAAQALQEYIDNNPQEALQPWIRLMDVYRMAGMRTEFENVARNLNLNFNVEVLSWSEGAENVAAGGENEPRPVAPRPRSLEDMPRLMKAVAELWSSGDVVGYLYQLLRDNRDGQRLGFAFPVVEDILFLIELKETANRMEIA